MYISAILKQILRKSKNYLEWYYDSYVWKDVTYRGIRTLKFVPDLWNYHEIIYDRGIEYIVEFGTRHGGSALFFADILSGRSDSGFVISVDIESKSRQIGSHPCIRFLIGDSTSNNVSEQITKLLPNQRKPGTTFWILDSDHSKLHVLKELNNYVPLMQTGDYLIVEDTCINGHPVRSDFGPGPWEAIEEFKEQNPGLLINDQTRENKYRYTFAPNGYYIRT